MDTWGDRRFGQSEGRLTFKVECMMQRRRSKPRSACTVLGINTEICRSYSLLVFRLDGVVSGFSLGGKTLILLFLILSDPTCVERLVRPSESSAASSMEERGTWAGEIADGVSVRVPACLPISHW